MRSILYLAVSAFAAFAAAQSGRDNAFNIPKDGYHFAAGKPTQLSWEPTTEGTVTLKLQKGQNTTPQDGIIIADKIPNSGSYAFTPPADLGPGSDYNIQIIDNNDPTNMNFTPMFSVEGTTGTATGLPTETASSSSTASDKATETTASATTSATTSASTTESTTTSQTASSTSERTSTPSSTSDPTTAPDPNGAMSLAVPGSMLSAVLALMAFL
ncbi:hypothetical protein AJ79_05679 [Helicocarpus griseus UAMH5409]|uniref:Yeast cell wall synthesis Kre9/Knh1-like N-terminal domain-containing protein n=1 Tax=Helicocarpus griseus UAMH5409 TaxID=1447875 RepID=A0A2B7XLF3_9EURO|nr:hypothetical protein AJ79_05679 [Helicocarpus griseus UAMH5409]